MKGIDWAKIFWAVLVAGFISSIIATSFYFLARASNLTLIFGYDLNVAQAIIQVVCAVLISFFWASRYPPFRKDGCYIVDWRGSVEPLILSVGLLLPLLISLVLILLLEVLDRGFGTNFALYFMNNWITLYFRFVATLFFVFFLFGMHLKNNTDDLLNRYVNVLLKFIKLTGGKGRR